MKVSALLGVPPGLRPPRFSTIAPCLLKKWITVRVENPVPLTVIRPPAWVTDATVILAPIGAETALLFLLYLPSAPLLLTTKDPGPVNGELGSPLAGRENLI